MLKQIAVCTLCTVSMTVLPSLAGQSGNFKGHGSDVISAKETKMANGTTALLFEVRSIGWIDSGDFSPGHVNGNCRGVGTLNGSGAYKGDVTYCTYWIDDKTGYTIKILNDDEKGGSFDIVGGTGALAGATGKGKYTILWGAPQGDVSKWTYEVNYKTP